MGMNIKISIVIPVYNVGNQISKCIDSVVSQTWSNLEVIIVDDGSIDNTLSMAEAYAKSDNRIHIIHKENGGVTSARLAGVDVATGDYIGFVDGDDYIEPEMYETLLKNALDFNADISHCGYQMVFSNRVVYYYDTKRMVKQDKITGLRDLLEGLFIEPGLWNKLFHRKLFHRMMRENLMDINIKMNEDLLMNYFLFREANLSIYEDICPYHYLVNKDYSSSSNITESRLLDPIRVSKILLNEIGDNEELYPIVYSRYIRQLIGIYTMEARDHRQLIEPNRKKAKIELREQLKTIISEKNLSRQLKTMSFCAAYMPWMYRKIHEVYGKIKGYDKIYKDS